MNSHSRAGYIYIYMHGKTTDEKRVMVRKQASKVNGRIRREKREGRSEVIIL